MRESGVVESDEELLEEGTETLTPRRPWVLIVLSPILAVLALWGAVQWRNGLVREDQLRAELKQVYLEAESLRLQAAQAQQKGVLLERQLAELTGEKEKLAKQLAELEARLKAPKDRRPAQVRPTLPGR
jgi:septal ring factor EnvC (AmiA/AmiB activator)